MAAMKDLAIKIEDTCRACRAAYRCNGCVIGLRLDDGTQVRVNGQTKEITSVGGCTDGLQGGKCVQCSKHADDVADGVCYQEAEVLAKISLLEV